MHGGIPKLRRLSLLEYLLGVHMGIPKLERSTLQDLPSSSSIAHLKIPFIHNSLQSREVSALLKLFSSTTNKYFQEGLLFLLPSQNFLQRKSKLKDCKTVKRKTGTEAEKNRTVERKEFFSMHFCNSNQKTLNRRLKGNCMEHTVKKFRSKR